MFQTANWLDTCGRHGITHSPEKFCFAQDEVEFAGIEITKDSVRPCKKYIRAIADFPTPRSLTDIRSWFGLVNQLSYAFSMADTMLPFRELLNSFHWDKKLQQAFEESKLTIINEIHKGIKIFDKTKPTCLATDWSKQGIGYWLFQKHCSHCSCPSNDLFCYKQGWKITLVVSRFTHAAESRYAPIEGEALAIADALDKARHFVLGCKNLSRPPTAT